ncbi:MAG TPA: porin family protein [Bacteroidales bacterium]|nr:porin family protein [Bacteroidales bacterium]HRX97547.1 porin family protein [Bacteroidales bacterium]
MKKMIVFAMAFLFASITFGQLSLGIKGGVNMNTLSTDLSDYEKAAKTGFLAGAFVRIGDKWHLQPEAYFTAKKGELTYDVDYGTGSVSNINQEITLNSLDIPVLIGYKLIDPPTMNVRLQAGPVASIVTSKKFDLMVDKKSVETPDDMPDNFKDLNWGLQFGAGVDFLFLTVDVRYELGLSNIYNKPDDAADSDLGSLKNNVFFVSVGWKFM